MNDILGVFKQKAEDLIAAINQRGGVSGTIDGIRRQMAVSDQKRNIAKAKSDLKRLDGQVNELVTAVGVQAVGLYKAGSLQSPELNPLCEHVAQLEDAMEQQRAELTRLEAELALTTPSEETGACPTCGKMVPDGATFCPHCGSALPVRQGFCMQCGAPLREGAKFCAQCGKSV